MEDLYPYIMMIIGSAAVGLILELIRAFMWVGIAYLVFKNLFKK